MKYRTIVIDPPWKVSSPRMTHERTGRLDAMPYSMMTDAQIADFPIDDFADMDCGLFVWAIQSRVAVVIDMVRKWGFRYSRCITWDKANGPNTAGFSQHTELLIYAYRGRSSIRWKSPILRTIYHAKRTTHSEKPAVIYEDLKRCTAEPRIDIFARRRHPGFDAWGDQVEDSVQQTL